MDKTIPIKPNNIITVETLTEGYCKNGTCPRCELKQVIDLWGYCPVCGQALDWCDKKEVTQNE